MKLDEPIVADSGPLIALASIEKLDLLPRLHSKILVPAGVYREVVDVGRGRPGAHELSAATWIEVAQVGPVDPLLLDELGTGEAETIALAASRPECRVLIDERRGRRVAALVYGLKVRGTLGTLVAAKRRGIISSVRPLLSGIVDAGYFISPKLIDAACRSVGE